ncbi:MAG: ubiquitin-like domain-containing protein [Chloroflexota bacterium]
MNYRLLLFGGLGLLLLLGVGYNLWQIPITVVIDGESRNIRVDQPTMAGISEALGIELIPEDVIDPAFESELSSGQTVTIELARPVLVTTNGGTHQIFTQEAQIDAVFAQAGFHLASQDVLLMDDQSVSLEDRLPPLSLSEGDAEYIRPDPVQFVLHQAIPVTLYEDQASTTFYTIQPTLGEALLEQDISIFVGDDISPDLGARLQPGMQIYLERAMPVHIEADGRTIKTRTHGRTVGEVLAEEGIALMGQDFSRPPPDYVIAPNELIEVVRVRETTEIEQEIIPFETSWLPDEALEIDQQEIRQAGANGVIKTRARIRYENEQIVWREVEDEWLDQPPQDRIIVYGTDVVVRTLQTPTGPIEYWRKVRMLATGYSAATSGKPADHPQYGITRSGLQAGRGIVAIDLRVMPLFTDLYVDDYGKAIAGDTGGLILGKRIDLGFPDGEIPVNTYGWRDVYWLTPVPSADEIRYVLPQWPQP